MDILSQADDKRAKPAFVHAIKNYKPGDNDDEAKSATRAVIKNKDLYVGDNDLGAAFVAALKNVKFADRRSGELGGLLGHESAGLRRGERALEELRHGGEPDRHREHAPLVHRPDVVDVVVEGAEAVDVGPHALVAGVEDVRAVGVHLDAGRRLGLAPGVPAEVAPPLDPTGITALSGANLLFEITCLVAAAVARRRAAEG